MVKPQKTSFLKKKIAITQKWHSRFFCLYYFLDPNYFSFMEKLSAQGCISENKENAHRTPCIPMTNCNVFTLRSDLSGNTRSSGAPMTWRT